MAKKIHELAKELQMSSKELLEKAAELGIEAKSHMSTVDEGAEKKIRSKLTGKADAETTIVKVEHKNEVAEDKGESKVTVKTAHIDMPTMEPKKEEKPAPQKSEAKKSKLPPLGKPVPRDGSNKPKPPIGKVVPKEQSDKRKQEEEDAKAAELAAKKAEEEKLRAEAEAKVKAEEEAKAKAEAEAKAKAEAEAKAKAEAEEAEKPAPAEEKPAEEKVVTAEETPTEEKPAEDTAKEEKAPEEKAEKSAKGEKKKSKDTDRLPRVKIIKKADPNEPKPEATRKNKNKKKNQDQGKNEKGEGKTKGQANFKKTPDYTNTTASAGKGKRGDKHGKKEYDKYDKMEKGKKNALHNSRDYDDVSLEKKERRKASKAKKGNETEVEEIIVPEGAIVVTVPITVAGFCEQCEVSTSKAIMALMKMGIMANINQNLDEDIVQILGAEMGLEIVVGKVEEELVEEGIETFEDKEEDLKDRPPIITVMGHVDHGKTSILDAIRNTNVTAGESGGITQHIGASEIVHEGKKIVFLDTPGHEAFTAMRARGAHVTDIAVLVVAADDGVMPQTIESISHARAAGVPIIVAINKMDKPGANPDRVKQELAENNVLVEDWGGDVISVPVSAKTGEGIDNLLEMILLQAEVLELKANPDRLAQGTVIEARLDKAKGVVASLLVLNGTLKAGMSLVAGTCAGKIRLMTNDKGKKINKAGPATAVRILGLDEVPQAGDEFNAVKDASDAREIAAQRAIKLREEVLAKNASTTLEQLFSQLQEGEVKDLNLIVKADVQGSVGAIVASLEKLKNENVRVKIIHTGVGTVTESDVMLAETAGAIIVGFNVRPSANIITMADRAGVEIRTYRVIYELIKEVEDAMVGMLDPEFKEVILGQVEVRETFKVPGVGTVAGAYVTDGKVVRNAEIRLVRDGIVIHEGKISSLKRFKDDAKEVLQGFECGLGIEDYNDVKIGDVIECFVMEEVKRGAE